MIIMEKQMAHYKIEINYTSNKNKAAKFKIKDNDGKVILKSDISIPDWIHEHDSYSMGNQLSLHNFIPEYSPSNRFADITKITHFHQLFGKDYIGDKSKVSALMIIKKDDFNDDKKIQSINKCLTLSEENFEILKNILLNEHSVSLTLNKKWYMFGQKKCIKNSNSELNSYLSLSEQIEAEEKNIKQRITDKENKKNSGLKNFIKSALSFGVSLISNNHTSENSSTTTGQTTVKKSSNSSRSVKDEDYSPGIFASFMQITEAVSESVSSSVSYKSSDCSSYSSSDSSCSSPSFD